MTTDSRQLYSRTRRAAIAVVRRLLFPKRNATASHPATIWFYPEFSTLEELGEQYHRCLWYLPYNGRYRVMMPVSPHLYATLGPQQGLLPPPWQAAYWGEDSHIQFYPAPQRFKVRNVSPRADRVVLWKPDSKQDYLGSAWLRLIGCIQVLDKHQRGEGEAWRYASFQFDLESASEREQRRRHSHSILRARAGKLAEFSKAYIFGTGPSLADAYGYDFSDGIRVVCNTIVKNRQLLEHIRPHFIAAADGALHYGCSQYAHQFRKELLEALERYDAALLLPDKFAPLMLSHYPELAVRLIGIPFTAKEDNLAMLENLCTRGGGSVFTELLIPLASSMADRICVLGFDGRRKNDTKFWSHDPKSQYGLLYETIQASHPGLRAGFDYESYFEGYCRRVEDIITYGESLGKQYVSLAPSTVPALQSRHRACGVQNISRSDE